MLYTVSQSYEYLNKAIGKDTIRSKMQNGEIPAYFDGKKYVTTQKQLDMFIKQLNAQIETTAERFNALKRR